MTRPAPTVANESDTRKVAVYLRVSSEDQDLERQRQHVPDFAARTFPGVEQIIVTDDGKSAYKTSIFERQGGSQLVALIENGEIRAIAADAQDRLSRSGLLEWAAFAALCKKRDVAIFTADGGEIRTDVGGQMMGALKAIWGEDESTVKSHRARDAKQALAEQGYWHGGTKPWGMTATGDKRRLVLAPKSDRHRALILGAFERFDSGENLRAVARWLMQESGEPISRDLARKILRNAHHGGFIVLNGQRFEGKHEATVPTDLFWRVQHRLDKTSGKKPKAPRVQPFGSIARCACGSAVRFERKHGSYTYYACTDESCQRRHTAAYFEASIVLGLSTFARCMRELLSDPDYAAAPTDNTGAIQKTQAAQNENAAKIARVVDAIAEGALLREDAAPKLDSLYAERDALEQSSRRLQPEKSPARAERGDP